MPTDVEAWARRARVLLREVTKQVKPHAVPEALRWDIVDLLGEATYSEYLTAHNDGDACAWCGRPGPHHPYATCPSDNDGTV